MKNQLRRHSTTETRFTPGQKSVAVLLLSVYGAMFFMFMVPSLCPHFRRAMLARASAAQGCRSCPVTPDKASEGNAPPKLRYHGNSSACPFIVLVLTPATGGLIVALGAVTLLTRSRAERNRDPIPVGSVPLPWLGRAPPSCPSHLVLV